MFEPFSLLPRSPSGLPRTAEPVLLAYIAEIYNFAARQSHISFKDSINRASSREKGQRGSGRYGLKISLSRGDAWVIKSVE